jgi:hypothetical protein
MCAIAQPIILALVAELHHGASTELLGLLGALLRAALPSLDITNQIKLHLTMWSLPVAVTIRRISNTARRFRSLSHN